jgi:hypothetical protein
LKLSHTVTSDGAIDVAFIQDGGNQNPSVKAIEIVEVVTPGTEDDASVPDRFVLHGNYPNPFNPSTTVVFDLPRAGEVNIQVYDMLGRRVLGTKPEMLAAGTQHQIVVDASSLASGIYLYRVVAHMANDTVIRSGRMSLIK